MKQFVGKKNCYEESNRQPFVAKCSRPVPARVNQLPRGVPNKHERTRQAKEVSCRKYHEHEQSTKMQPSQSRRQIFRRQRGPEQTVQDHDDAQHKWGIWSNVRECHHHKNAPIPESRNKSNSGWSPTSS